MSGYTKMFESIVHSTIWREPNHIRLVWITMLAMKDEDGVVEASVPGLMDAARVTRKEVDDALDHLASPDPDSRNPAHEGRRIEKVDGGWYLLNHDYYKNKMSKEEKAERKRELARIRQQKFRDGCNANVTQSNPASRCITPNNAKPPIRSDQIIPDQIIDKTKSAPADGFDAFWSAYNKKVGKVETRKQWKAKAKAGTLPPISDVLVAVKRYCAYEPDPNFRLDPERWVKRERWNDEPERGGPMVGRPQPKMQEEVDDGPAATDEEKAAAFKQIRNKLGMNPFTAEGEGT